MSILSSMVHGEIQDLPNAVHNRSTKKAQQGAMTPQAQRLAGALRAGEVKPALYYGDLEQVNCRAGVWQTPHTVEELLEHREETPNG